MVHLTTKEKADRFDSLQLAIKLAAKRYEDQKKSAEKNLESYTTEVDAIAGFLKGSAEAYGEFLEDLQRWIV